MGDQLGRDVALMARELGDAREEVRIGERAGDGKGVLIHIFLWHESEPRRDQMERCAIRIFMKRRDDDAACRTKQPWPGGERCLSFELVPERVVHGRRNYRSPPSGP